MMRILKFLAAEALLVVLVALPALAQTAPSPLPPPAPASPGAPGPSGPAAPTPEGQAKEKQVEGPVKKVDPAAKTVQVGWFLGLLRTTLEVTDDTQIHSEGMKGSFADIREGANVKAFYEVRNGKNVAKWIEVTPPPGKERVATPTDSPGRPAAPMESPGGAFPPPAAKPQTP